jgi:hypothetical protein
VEKLYDLLVENGKIFISLPGDDSKMKWPTMAGHEPYRMALVSRFKGQRKDYPILSFQIRN